MNGWTCFWIFIITILIFIGLLIGGGFLLWQIVKNKYQNQLSLECSNWQMEEYSIPDLVSFQNNIYQPNNALALLLINFNTTMSHCNDAKMSMPSQFDIIEPIVGNDNTIFGYFLYSTSLALSLFTFTGTYGVTDWLFDADITQTAPSTISNYQGLVHSGFWSIYIQIQSQIETIWNKYKQQTNTLIITGHSLGGALATLCSYEYVSENPIIYTFGSPRVGNPTFAASYNKLYNIIQGDSYELANVWRIVNNEDLIPSLPFPVLTSSLLYQHVGVPHDFSINLKNYIYNHTKAYIQGIQEEI